MVSIITISILSATLLFGTGGGIIPGERREEKGSARGGNMNQAVKGVNEADDCSKVSRQQDNLRRWKCTD